MAGKKVSWEASLSPLIYSGRRSIALRFSHECMQLALLNRHHGGLLCPPNSCSSRGTWTNPITYMRAGQDPVKAGLFLTPPLLKSFLQRQILTLDHAYFNWWGCGERAIQACISAGLQGNKGLPELGKSTGCRPDPMLNVSPWCWSTGVATRCSYLEEAVTRPHCKTKTKTQEAEL